MRRKEREAGPLTFVDIFGIYAALAIFAMVLAFLIIWAIARPFEVTSFVAGSVITGILWRSRWRLRGFLDGFRRKLHHA